MVDSLYVNENGVELSQATRIQIREILSNYSGGMIHPARATGIIADLVEDLINQELPALIANNLKAGTVFLSAIERAKNKKDRPKGFTAEELKPKNWTDDRFA